MRQPLPPDPIEQLGEFLDLAVPLRSVEMALQLRRWRYTSAEAEAWLTNQAQMAGIQLGVGGDGLQFSDGRPRSGSVRTRVQRTAGEIASGVAAAALLAQLTGTGPINVFGRSYGAASAAHAAEPENDRT